MQQGGTIKGCHNPYQTRFSQNTDQRTNREYFLQKNTIDRQNNYEYIQQQIQKEQEQQQNYKSRELYQGVIQGGTEKKKIFNDQISVQNDQNISRFSQYAINSHVRQITSITDPLIKECEIQRSQDSLKYSEEQLLKSQPKTSVLVRQSTVEGKYQQPVSIIQFNQEEKASEQQSIIQGKSASLPIQQKQHEQLSLIKFDESQIVQQYKGNKNERKLPQKIQLVQPIDEQPEIDHPPKVSNFVTVNTSKSGEYKLKDTSLLNISGPIQITVNEVEVLKEMNQERKQRIHQLDIPYFSSLTLLQKSDCLSDLKTQDQNLRDYIVAQFPFIRNVRGDGNCLFSSLVFPYLECIYLNNEFDSVLNSLVIHNIYWKGKLLIDKLIAQRQIQTIFQQLKKLAEKTNLGVYSEVVLHYMNTVNGFYDLMIIFIRSLILEGFNQYSQNENYRDFFEEERQQENQELISTFEEEGEANYIHFFIEKTQINVKIIQFDQENPLRTMQFLEPKIKKNTQQKKKDTFITLKYNQGHYDILYSRMMKQIQKSEIPNLNDYLIDFCGLY